MLFAIAIKMGTYNSLKATASAPVRLHACKILGVEYVIVVRFLNYSLPTIFGFTTRC